MVARMIRVENDQDGAEPRDAQFELGQPTRIDRRSGSVLDSVVHRVWAAILDVHADDLAMAEEIADRCEVEGRTAVHRAGLDDEVRMQFSEDLLIDPQV